MADTTRTHLTAELVVTAQWLAACGACRHAVRVVAEEWPDGVRVTPDSLRRAQALGLDIGWLTQWLPAAARAAYDAAMAPADAAYDAAMAPAGAAYATYDAAGVAANAAYDAAMAAALWAALVGGQDRG